MWLIVTLVATLISAVVYLVLKKQRKEYKLDVLVLMFLGMFLMVLVDEIISILSGEEFTGIATDGLIANSIMLGLLMILPVFLVWGCVVLLSKISNKKK